MNALCELTLPANVLKTLSEFPPLVVESLRTALMAAFANRKLGQTSRIAKCRLFNLFRAVAERFGRLSDFFSTHPDDQLPSYRAVKDASSDFQAAKALMYARFRSQGFGRWVTKPPEEEAFTWGDVLRGPAPVTSSRAEISTTTACDVGHV